MTQPIFYGMPIGEHFPYDPSKPRWLNICKAYVMTGDYDPMYKGLHELTKVLDEETMSRLMLTYSLFYHVGFACYVAEVSTEDNYWETLLKLYADAPRGTARRYFRGQQGLDCINYLQSNYKTAKEFLQSVYRTSYSELVKAFEPVPAFGDYHIWKWLDFFEVVLEKPVSPDNCIVKLPSEPRKGAALVAEEMGFTGEQATFESVVNYMVEVCVQENMLALPNAQRPINIQEVETFLCGIYHHYRDRDYVGKDLDKVQAQLVDGNWGEIANKLKGLLPPRIAPNWFREPKSTVSLFDAF